LQTLLWALNEFKLNNFRITIFTDSQNIAGLLERRSRLEAKNFRSKNKELINNAALYQEFYCLYDKLYFQIIKIKGHQQTKNKNFRDLLFTLVDKASRNALHKGNKL